MTFENIDRMAAGPSLLDECAQYLAEEHGYRVQTGDTKITGAGNLSWRLRKMY
ncbi:MAG: hypothetical protein MJ240_06080 [Kiritimatiellae bacterium]|nr:hypothetical protein [Kiritimatiellia bacterium]